MATHKIEYEITIKGTCDIDAPSAFVDVAADFFKREVLRLWGEHDDESYGVVELIEDSENFEVIKVSAEAESLACPLDQLAAEGYRIEKGDQVALMTDLFDWPGESDHEVMVVPAGVSGCVISSDLEYECCRVVFPEFTEGDGLDGLEDGAYQVDWVALARTTDNA